MTSDSIREKLLTLLPPLFTRADIPKYLGSLISPRYLANLDSEGAGPPRFKAGKKTAYVRESWVDWYIERFIVVA